MPLPLAAAAELADLRSRALAELTDDILPFWEAHAFRADGFLVGKLHDDMTVDDEPDRHAVLVARMVWTFAAAARAGIDDESRWIAVADRALTILTESMWDDEHGGVFWSVDAAGAPASRRKQVYAQAFAIYGLAEYAAATGDDASLARAMGLFELLETHSRDREHGGYWDAHDATWGPLEDTALSSRDLSVPKSMNTQLHVLEAYTTLARVSGDARVIEALRALLAVTLDHVVVTSPWHACALFFERDWTSVVDTISYGHDIEASWLAWEAAEALVEAAGPAGSDPALADLVTRTRVAALGLADAVAEHGTDPDGGVMYEGGPEGPRVTTKDWWPQAEGVVGWLNAFALSGDVRYRDQAAATWDFLDAHTIDHANGEWFAVLDRDGNPVHGIDAACKIGPWKCPYHNARACLEVVRRIEGPTA